MSKIAENAWNTTPLTLNVMHNIADRLGLDIQDDVVSNSLYWICCDLEDWPEHEGFGSSDSFSYIEDAKRVFHITLAS
jgi:hypothetical protein